MNQTLPVECESNIRQLSKLSGLSPNSKIYKTMIANHDWTPLVSFFMKDLYKVDMKDCIILPNFRFSFKDTLKWIDMYKVPLQVVNTFYTMIDFTFYSELRTWAIEYASQKPSKKLGYKSEYRKVYNRLYLQMNRDCRDRSEIRLPTRDQVITTFLSSYPSFKHSTKVNPHDRESLKQKLEDAKRMVSYYEEKLSLLRQR